MSSIALTLINVLASYSTLKSEDAFSSETPVDFNRQHAVISHKLAFFVTGVSRSSSPTTLIRSVVIGAENVASLIFLQLDVRQQTSIRLVPNPAIEHNSELVLSTSGLHNEFN
jgi:hypothetical protein